MPAQNVLSCSACVLTGMVLWSCTKAPSARTPAPESAPQTARAIPVPELTADERMLADELESHVKHLAEKIGERNAQKSWELADAADYLALELEGMGLALERNGYETEDVAAQNLAVTIGGGIKGDEVLLVGAHYDSPLGAPGNNAGATGTAALLSLVRMMKDAQLLRTLKVVFFSMGESPHGDGEGRGARRYVRSMMEEAKKAEEREKHRGGVPLPQAEVVGLVHFDRLGAFSEPKTTADPDIVVQLHFTKGGERLFELMQDSLADEPVSVDGGPFAGTLAESDVKAVSELGIPVVAVSGPSQEGPVHYDSLARVVMRARRGIGRILGEQPTNDAMLTPL